MLLSPASSRFSASRVLALFLLLGLVGLGNLAMSPRSADPFPAMTLADGTVVRSEQEFMKAFYTEVTYPRTALQGGKIGLLRVDCYIQPIGQAYSATLELLRPDSDLPEDLAQITVVGYRPAHITEVRPSEDPADGLAEEVARVLSILRPTLLDPSREEAFLPFMVRFMLE